MRKILLGCFTFLILTLSHLNAQDWKSLNQKWLFQKHEFSEASDQNLSEEAKNLRNAMSQQMYIQGVYYDFDQEFAPKNIKNFATIIVYNPLSEHKIARLPSKYTLNKKAKTISLKGNSFEDNKGDFFGFDDITYIVEKLTIDELILVEKESKIKSIFKTK